MKDRPNRSWVISVALSLGIVAATTHVQAVERDRGQITILSPGEVQNLNNRERRLDFQQRQQFNREIDSLAIQRQPRPQVPVMKPSCPLQTSGTARTC